MKTLLVLAGLAALVYALVCGAFFVGQRAFIYFPVAGRAPDVPAFTLRREGVDVVVSTHAAPSPRAVVYFGGNAEDVSRAVPGLREAFGDAAVYAMHYRGYGGSGGVPGERMLVADGLALVRRVAATHAHVTLVGRSLGSGVAVQVAHAHRPQRLVLVTPFDSLAAVARRHYPWLPTGLLLRDRFDSTVPAGSIAVATSIIAAGGDTIVPPSHAHALARAFPPGTVRMAVLEGVGHNDVDRHPGYLAAVRAD